MKISDPEIFRLHADFCKVLSNPKRLMIIALLSKRELSVGELSSASGVPLTTISQHLRMLRERDVVIARKEGQTVFYQLTDHRIMDACVRIRTILLDNMRQRGTLAREIDPEGVIVGD